MRILVLGAGGQLGSEWQTFLNERKMDVHPYTSGDVDITNSKEVGQVIEDVSPDLLINCAAYTDVDRAEEERERALEVNGTAVDYLARVCKRNEIKLVHFSTDYVFPGKKEDREKYPEGYVEDHPVSPVNWYGETKLRGEQAIRHQDGTYLIVRVSWLCGKYGSNFVTKMLALAEKHKELRVVNDQYGSPTFTGNVVLNTFNLIQKQQEGIFHITTEGMITWYDFARAVFRITDKRVPVTAVTSDEFSTTARRPFFSKLNMEKIKKVPGTVTRDWEEGLTILLRELKK